MGFRVWGWLWSTGFDFKESGLEGRAFSCQLLLGMRSPLADCRVNPVKGFGLRAWGLGFREPPGHLTPLESGAVDGIHPASPRT